MPTLAQIVIDYAAAGHPMTGRLAESLAAIPPVQWEIYFDQLAPICPSRIEPDPVRQQNALRIEILPDSGQRCSRQAPDGRGPRWLMSGGDPLAYGRCCEAGCPRRR